MLPGLLLLLLAAGGLGVARGEAALSVLEVRVEFPLERHPPGSLKR